MHYLSHCITSPPLHPHTRIHIKKNVHITANYKPFVFTTYVRQKYITVNTWRHNYQLCAEEDIIINCVQKIVIICT